MKKYKVVREDWDYKTMARKEYETEESGDDSYNNTDECKCYFCNHTFSDIFEGLGDENSGQFTLRCPCCDALNTVSFQVQVEFSTNPVICTVCQELSTAGEVVLEVGRYGKGEESNDFLCQTCADNLKDLRDTGESKAQVWHRGKLKELRDLPSWPIEEVSE